MGFGIALNLLKHNYKLSIIKHKNPKPIVKLVKNGAKEEFNYKNLVKSKNIIIICVTNTLILNRIINKIIPYIEKKTLIIDITTNEINGSNKIYNLLKKNNISYTESPVMGGPVQAKEGLLGAMVGCDKKNYDLSKKILSIFCKKVFYFGKVGNATKAKLINNYLSLSTATFAIETIKSANLMNIKLDKLYGVAKLGSGYSTAFKRIAENILKNNYDGYIFTVKNTLKDLRYINEIMKKNPTSKKIAKSLLNYYKKEVSKGNGDLFISQLAKLD